MRDGLGGLHEAQGCTWSRSDAILSIHEVYRMLFEEDAARVRASSSDGGGVHYGQSVTDHDGDGGQSIAPNPELRESYAEVIATL